MFSTDTNYQENELEKIKKYSAKKKIKRKKSNV